MLINRKTKDTLSFVLVVFLIVGAFASLLTKSKANKQTTFNNVSPTSPIETEAKVNILTDVNREELEEYYKVYENPYVLYLRRALDAYLANDSSDVNISMAAIEKDSREDITSGFEAFSKEYYQSKFVVTTIDNSIAGGKDIQIIFQDKPDRLFYAWVYQLAGGDYELKGFNSRDNIEPEAMEEMVEFFAPLLFDKEHAL